ncbi:hypothetical protein EJV47_24550 [Hymenobacter gummosus]|uniref:Uncharacterized protein n=1 Tax=Hymenobacter gummosus TaxID=1776032 RepID=A0A3S0IJI9_9BACT|nr:hypothetical protein [Hymenobacter gummosus]RTQ45662.1 hypothetical protein EJV47_24550 [Hymenobacter gummosus]
MKTPLASPLFLLLGCGLLSGLGACQRQLFSGPTPPALLATDPAVRQLQFGYGSAYSSHRTTYTLRADGVLLAQAGIGLPTGSPPTAALKVPAAQARAAFRRLAALSADSLYFEQPGPHYYFLEGCTAAGQPVRLAWGRPDTLAPHGARQLYQQLQALLPPSL